MLEQLTATGIRTLTGLVVAFALGFAGMALTGLFVPPTGASDVELLLARLGMIGGGATVGASLGWAVAMETRREVLTAVLLALAGALSGGWVGLIYGEANVFHPDQIRRVQRISQVVVIGAAVGANLLPLVESLGRLALRYRREMG